MIRAEPRSDAGTCHTCARPLEFAQVVSRRYRKLRSGDWIGSRGESETRVCVCGRRIRLMRAVNLVEA